jgi:hypothetical protein
MYARRVLAGEEDKLLAPPQEHLAAEAGWAHVPSAHFEQTGGESSGKVDQDPAKLGPPPHQTFGASYSAKGKAGTP